MPVQPEGAIVVDESLTSGGSYWDASAGAPPFSHLSLTGGSIGIGPPMAVGAAVACPDRTVINFQADGSGMYTLQVNTGLGLGACLECRHLKAEAREDWFSKGLQGGRAHPSRGLCGGDALLESSPLALERNHLGSPTLSSCSTRRCGRSSASSSR